MKNEILRKYLYQLTTNHMNQLVLKSIIEILALIALYQIARKQNKILTFLEEKEDNAYTAGFIAGKDTEIAINGYKGYEKSFKHKLKTEEKRMTNELSMREVASPVIEKRNPKKYAKAVKKVVAIAKKNEKLNK